MKIVWSSLILLVVTSGTIGLILSTMMEHAGFGPGPILLVSVLVGFVIGFVWQSHLPVFK